MRYQLIISVSVCVLFLLAGTAVSFESPAFAEDATGFEDFLSQFKERAESRDSARYLDLFLPGAREKEEIFISSMFQDLGMESLKVVFPPNWASAEEINRVYAQAVFENRTSALIQVWQISCMQLEGRWMVVEKDVSSQISSLHKMTIPNERVERVKSFRVHHMDIDIRFDNALVFYDNLPDLETGMIVLGRGQISFTPSPEREKHQLEMVFKKDHLEDGLRYVFLRFSNSFFEKSIQIVRDASLSQDITEAETNQAYSIFAKHYPRSFTLNNSLTGGLLTSIPSGDEAVFEFSGLKIGTFTYIYSPYSDEEISLFQWKKGRILNLYSPAINSEGKRLFVTVDETYDVQDYEIDIDYNPHNSYLSGRALVAFESKRTLLQQIKLKLNSDLEILRIYDKNKNPLFYTFDRLRDLLYIYFLQPVSRGETSAVEVYYRGELAPKRQVTDVITGPQARDATSLTFIAPPRLDTYLYSRAAYWYPSTSDEDYFRARLKLIVPPKYNVVANGQLIETSTINEVDAVEGLEKVGRAVYVFQTGTPVKYLSFIVGQFGRPKSINRGIPIKYFRTSEILPQNMDYGEEAAKILDFFQTKFGQFPFDKMEIVHRQWSQSGGHSPASFIVLNELPRYPGIDPMIEKNNPVSLNRYREYYLAHEIAHQWWGQAVAWKTYHDQWISEGLSQYAAVLYLQEKYGEGAFSYILKKFSRWTRKKTMWGSITLGSRISFFNFEAYQAIVYNKTSLVLNMLRDMLGDDLFFEGIRRFYQKFRYDVAATADFFNVMQETAPLDLRPFFDNWFNSYELPDVVVAHATEKTDEAHLLKVAINQDHSHFVFPLWIRWEVDRQPYTKMVIVKDKVQRFIIETTGKAKKVAFNYKDSVPGRIR